jgi:hypothetical protein
MSPSPKTLASDHPWAYGEETWLWLEMAGWPQGVRAGFAIHPDKKISALTGRVFDVWHYHHAPLQFLLRETTADDLHLVRETLDSDPVFLQDQKCRLSLLEWAVTHGVVEMAIRVKETGWQEVSHVFMQENLLYPATQHPDEDTSAALVEVLLAIGADGNTACFQGMGPLALTSHGKVRDVLLAHGTHLLMPASLSSHPQYRTYFEVAMATAKSPNHDFANWLLDHGFPVDQRGKLGGTPLMNAIMHGQEALARRLIDMGANVNLQSEWGQTALYYAIDRCPALVIPLMEAGADETLPDHAGRLVAERLAHRPGIALFHEGLRAREAKESQAHLEGTLEGRDSKGPRIRL